MKKDLNQLLQIKQRKEKKLNSAIEELTKQGLSLLEKERNLQQHRYQLQKDWQLSNHERRILNQADFILQKNKLNKYYQDDMSLSEKIQKIKEAYSLVQQQQVEKKKLRKQIMRDQEKFQFLIEEYDAYF
jgi:hypothetical protein